MRSLRVLLLAGAAVVTMQPGARAADLTPPPPPMMAPVPDFGGGWYLRGDIGVAQQSVGRITNVLDATATSVTTLTKDFSGAGFVGIGVGYQFNSWLRFDVTGEYRAGSTFRGLQVYTPEPASPTGIGTDDYTATKSEWVGLANVYFDLGTWSGVTPFVGAGVGFAHNVISNFRDVNVPTAGVAFANTGSKTNFAWAVQAGVAYQVTPRTTIEFAYRYLNLGDAQSGDIITYTGVNNVVNPELFHSITSSDFKLGVRYMFDAPAPVEPAPPLIRKG
jgi:opacity protein-like surface antigen